MHIVDIWGGKDVKFRKTKFCKNHQLLTLIWFSAIKNMVKVEGGGKLTSNEFVQGRRAQGLHKCDPAGNKWPDHQNSSIRYTWGLFGVDLDNLSHTTHVKIRFANHQ